MSTVKATAKMTMAQFYAMQDKAPLIPEGLENMTMLKAYDAMLKSDPEDIFTSTHAYAMLYICDRLAQSDIFRLPRTVACEIIAALFGKRVGLHSRAFIDSLTYAANTDGSDGMLETAVLAHRASIDTHCDHLQPVLPMVCEQLGMCASVYSAILKTFRFEASMAAYAADMTYQKRPENCMARGFLGALRNVVRNSMVLNTYGSRGVSGDLCPILYKQIGISSQLVVNKAAFTVLNKHGNPFRTMNMAVPKK